MKRLAISYACGCAATASMLIESEALSALLLIAATAVMGVLGATHKEATP